MPSVLRQDRTQTRACRECGLGQGTDPGPLLTWDPLPSNSIQTCPFPTAGFEYHPLQEAFPLAATANGTGQTPNNQMQRTELGWGSPPRWVSDFTPHPPHLPLKGPAHRHPRPF